jgi:hypothetical protein
VNDESITPALPVSPAGKLPRRGSRRQTPQQPIEPEHGDAEPAPDQDEATSEEQKSKRIIDTYA